MNTQDLFTQLSEIRRSAISIIKDVMADINTTDINIEDTCITTPPLTHEGEEDYALARISLLPDGRLIFESDSEFNTITEGEDDLSADVLLEIAKWMKENASLDDDEEETMTVQVNWGGINADVLGLDEEVEVPARLDGADVDDYLEEMYGFRPAGWEVI